MDDAKESVLDRHFNRGRVIVSAIAVSVTFFLALANLVDRIQSDIRNVAIEHQRDIGELRTIMHGCTESAIERGTRIGNLEQQVYDLRFNPAKRQDSFTGTMGKKLEDRIDALEGKQ